MFTSTASPASTASVRPFTDHLDRREIEWGPARRDPEHPLHPGVAPDARDVFEQRPDDN